MLYYITLKYNNNIIMMMMMMSCDGFSLFCQTTTTTTNVNKVEHAFLATLSSRAQTNGSNLGAKRVTLRCLFSLAVVSSLLPPHQLSAAVDLAELALGVGSENWPPRMARLAVGAARAQMLQSALECLYRSINWENNQSSLLPATTFYL